MTAPASITCPFCGSVSYHPRDIAERYCGRCHQFHEFLADRTIVRAGNFYSDGAGEKRWVAPAAADLEAALHVCRRVADFPGGVLPAGGVADRCTRCGREVARQPVRRAPVVVCMQCAGIVPLPQES